MRKMDKIPRPSALNGKNWKMFKQMWTNYEIANDLQDQPETKRVAILLSFVGEDALKIYNTFQWNNESDSRNLNMILGKFEEYYSPLKNTTYERYIFNCRKQNPGETVDEFVTNLKLLAENCEFGAIKDSLIRDAIITGISDSVLREHMLIDSGLTLEKAVNMAKASERAKTESVNIATDRNHDHHINKLEKRQSTNEVKCKFCGRAHKLQRNFCPAYNKTCFKCGGMNHFENMCKTKDISRTQSKRPVNEIEIENSEEEEITIE